MLRLWLILAAMRIFLTTRHTCADKTSRTNAAADMKRRILSQMDFSGPYGKTPITVDVVHSAVSLAGGGAVSYDAAKVFFAAADTDHNGVITADQFAATLNDLDDDDRLLEAAIAQVGLEDSNAVFKAWLDEAWPVIRVLDLHPLCRVGFTLAGSKCYKLVGSAQSYDEAAAACKAIDADLPAFENATEWLVVQQVLREKNVHKDATAIWLRLKRMVPPSSSNYLQRATSWHWQDTFKLNDAEALWAVGEPDGFATVERAAVANTNCGIGLLVPKQGQKITFWADEDCAGKYQKLSTVCQQHPEPPDVDTGALNVVVTDEGLGDFNLELKDGGSVPGFDTKRVDEAAELNRQLNSNWILQWGHSTSAAKTGGETSNATSAKKSAGKSSLNNDLMPALACLQNRVKNTACRPAAGRRRKRGSCNDRWMRATFKPELVGWPAQPTIRYGFDKRAALHPNTVNVVREVTEYWSARTCVNFVQDVVNPDVIVARKKGCWSSIGRDTSQNTEKVEGRRRRESPASDNLDTVPLAGIDFSGNIHFVPELAALDLNNFRDRISKDSDAKATFANSSQFIENTPFIAPSAAGAEAQGLAFTTTELAPNLLREPVHANWETSGQPEQANLAVDKRLMDVEPASEKLRRAVAASARPQILSLGPGCDKFFVAAHEFGHLLGLDHEQSRRDRDHYVELMMDNIEEDKIFNFDLCIECCSEEVTPYDYGSIMHYAPNEFAKSATVGTMKDKKDGRYLQTMGNSWFPSFHDVWQINNLLCHTSCSSGGAVCKNGGYANPRNCGVCICPSGFGGQDCNTFEAGTPNGCGGLYEALPVVQEFATPGYPGAYFTTARCSWILKARFGKKVKLTLDPTIFYLPIDCRFGNIEIKDQADLTTSGTKYCGRNLPQSVISEDSRMVLIFHLAPGNKVPIRGIKAEFQEI